MRLITSKYTSTCPTCRTPIVPGSQVYWERGEPTVHAVCPKAALLALNVLKQDAAERATNVRALCDAINGPATSDALREQFSETLALIEDQLWVEYERQAAPALSDATALASLPKGIYRVSLDGSERAYGVSHVNVVAVPNEKYGNVKVGEWRGASVGRLYPDGRVAYWQDVDRDDPRVKAVVAAVGVLTKAADPTEYAKAYAVEASACWRCGADLVVDQSRERLMGPDCYRAQYGKGA